MSNILKAYQRLLVKFPLGMQAVQTGALMGLGDQIAQKLVERKSFEEIDLKRTAGFSAIGFFIAGPSTRTWYGILDKYIGSKGRSVALKKVFCDQVFFAPLFIAILIVSVGILQNGNPDKIKAKLSEEYLDILKNNYKLWPAVQLLNFTFVPLNYQVLVVQSVALLWSSYVSYRTNKE